MIQRPKNHRQEPITGENNTKGTQVGGEHHLNHQDVPAQDVPPQKMMVQFYIHCNLWFTAFTAMDKGRLQREGHRLQTAVSPVPVSLQDQEDSSTMPVNMWYKVQCVYVCVCILFNLLLLIPSAISSLFAFDQAHTL